MTRLSDIQFNKMIKSTKTKKKNKRKSKAKTKIRINTLRKNKETVEIEQPISVAPVVSLDVKSPPVMYFTSDTEKAIVEYNLTKDDSVRNKIYREKIQYAFEKIAENVFNTFKFPFNEVAKIRVQQEATTHMVMNIRKYNPEKGKAFGYFSIVAKNWFILENNTNYRRFKRQTEIVDSPGAAGEFIIKPNHETQNHDTREFIKQLVIYWDAHMDTLFPKKRDQSIAGAVVDIFRYCDRIEMMNKKALYLCIREHSGCHTQHITKIINRMLMTYKLLRREYLDTGLITGDFMSYQK